jgi:H+/Cl- antiporter ClcA
MPLTHFLMLLAVVVVLGAVSIWAATVAGVPFPMLAFVALVGAGVARLMTRVH